MSDVRKFVLREKDDTESGVFTGRQPRQAALKSANRFGGTKEDPVEVRLRERGTKKVHIYNAWRELVPAPEGKPNWMPDMINKPYVKKIGTEIIEKI
ncbi:MAG: chromosomal protein MC1 [Methanosarcinales archaeon]|uniref:Chromosomal protein MC1 n=1 Tax=Candidatus Ethanoperedens thermophilum TaxID=2766897 RepID=A0A848DB62_9EURY|nr:chromosomal protein MC1 [Candidatus Ethanoperedens thermophilum]